MMYSYVNDRLPPIELPSDRKTWEAVRPTLLAHIRHLVGLDGLDRRSPVTWSSKGFIDRDTYTIEKIVYESYPGMMVPALVYTPKGLTVPAAAMLNIPGHEYCDGKAGLSVQARSVNLVRRGVVVLAYDYIDTFERNTGVNACGAMPYGGGNDHRLSAFSYTARNPTGLEILDGIRAIDYLYTRKDVDRSRIGFTGESGGSNSTYWISALDDRIRLAVPVASVTTFDYWIRNNRNWDWHQRPPGIRRIAEISTLLALIAPRPVLVITSLRGTDSQEFPYDEAQTAVSQAKKIYNLYKAGENIQFWESRTSHGYQADKRDRMYGWVERHFLKKNVDTSSELPILFEPQDQLRCGLPVGNKTLADIYREWLEEPRSIIGGPAELRIRLRDLLGIGTPNMQPILSVQATTSQSGAIVRHWIVRSEPGIYLPAVEYTPRTTSVAGTVMVLGRTADLAAAVSPLLARNLRAVFFDLRGTGEIDSGGGRTDNWAWLMGQPWPGLWVRDVQAVANILMSEYGNAPIGVIGVGKLGKAALFAASLDARIAAVQVRLPFLSYREEARQGSVADVPRILSTLDLPEAAALVAPRACWLEFTASAPEEQILRTYRATVQAYSGASREKLVLRSEPSRERDWHAVADWFSVHLKQ